MTTTRPTLDHDVATELAAQVCWVLVALSPELGTLSIPVTTSMSIGRQADNDVVLAAQQISRRHAKFNQVGQQLYLQDLNSANGTFVNGEKIGNAAVAVTVNDEIGFADLLFVVATAEDRLDTDTLAMLATMDDLDKPTLVQAQPQPQLQPQANLIDTATPIATTPAIPEIATETVTLPPQVANPVATPEIAPQTVSPVATTPITPTSSIPNTPATKPNGMNPTWLVAIAIILLIAVLVITKMVL